MAEIDDGTGYIGYREACDIVAANIWLLGEETVSLEQCVGRIVASDVVATVKYPTTRVSLKDGFALKSADITHADRQNPVNLKVVGSAFAGIPFEGTIKTGCAVKVCTGAIIPIGADAVVSGEFCEEKSIQDVVVKADAEQGRNIQNAGSEVDVGTQILKKGKRMLPGYIGLAAAAGINQVTVYRRPRVGIISIGDEVVAPGGTLQAGQLFASNLVSTQAWLMSFGISCVTSIMKDNATCIRQELQKHFPSVDAIITNGGAWGSERDLAIGIMDTLRWQKLFHYLRMGPGKGTAFGCWENKPVFCLPGGPTSNAMAFLQLALPGLLRMSGDTTPPLQSVPAKLVEDVKRRNQAWTEFKDAMVTLDAGGSYVAKLFKTSSRLQTLAGANGLICIPEGKESLSCGEVVLVQLLKPRLDDQ